MALNSYTADEVAKFIFGTYGKTKAFDNLEDCKKIIRDLYSNIASICKEENVTYNEVLAGKLVIGVFEALNLLVAEIVEKL